MTSIEFYERSTIIKRIETLLNQINQRYFEGNHGILSVTDNGDYVTVKNRGGYLADYDTQKLFDALENFSQEDREFLFPYDLWDYLDHCKSLPEDQKSDNELIPHRSLTFSEKRQVALVDWLLSEPAPAPVHETSSLDDWTLSLIPQSPDFQLRTESSTLSELVEELEQKNKILEKKIQELEYSQTWVENLQQRVHDLECAVYLLQQENKQLNNQTETKPEPQPEPKPTANKAKKPKFKLPEAFADYQQECDDLINALSSFYNIKKGKWNGNILQFVLTPTDVQKENQLYPYPDKWKAGLYLQPGQWTIDKVNLADPDDWEDWFLDINDFADANDIEIS